MSTEAVATKTLFERIGGMDAVVRLAKAWHAQCMADPIAAHPFEHGYHPDHNQRIAAYWAQAWGGPTTFTDDIATEQSVVHLHACNGEHVEMDRAAIACFARALDEAELPDDHALKADLLGYFAWGTGRMAGFTETGVHEGLSIPIWSSATHP